MGAAAGPPAAAAPPPKAAPRPLSKPPQPLARAPAPDKPPQKAAPAQLHAGASAGTAPSLHDLRSKAPPPTLHGSRAKSAAPQPTWQKAETAEDDDHEEDDDLGEEGAVEDALRAHEEMINLLKRRAETALGADRFASEPKRREVEEVVKQMEEAQKLLQGTVDLLLPHLGHRTPREGAATKPGEEEQAGKAGGDGGPEDRTVEREGRTGRGRGGTARQAASAAAQGTAATTTTTSAPRTPTRGAPSGSGTAPTQGPAQQPPGAAASSSAGAPGAGPPDRRPQQPRGHASPSTGDKPEDAGPAGHRYGAELLAFSAEVGVPTTATVEETGSNLIIHCCYAVAKGRLSESTWGQNHRTNTRKT